MSGNNIFPIAIQAAFNAQAQKTRFSQEIQLQLLQSHLVSLEQAKTPKEVRQSYEQLNKAWAKIAKNAPGLPDEFINQIDLQNIERMAGNTIQIKAEFARMSSDAFQMFGQGKPFEEVSGFVNGRIETLSGQFGAADVEQFTPEIMHEIRVMAKAQSDSTLARQQMKMGVIPYLSRAINDTPNGVAWAQEVYKNSHAVATARVTQSWTGDISGGDFTNDKLNAMKVARGLAELEASGQDPDQSRALLIGQRLFEGDVQRYEKAYLGSMEGIINDTLDAVGLNQQQKANALIGFVNQIFPDGTLSPLGQELFNPADIALTSAIEQGEMTPEETSEAQQTIVKLAQGGFLGEELQGKDIDEIVEFMSEGEQGTDLLKSIKAPQMDNNQITSESMFDLMFDRNGGLKPNAAQIVDFIPPEALRSGDPAAWRLADHISQSMEPLTYDGEKGFFEEMVDVVEDDAQLPLWKWALQGWASGIEKISDISGRPLSATGKFLHDILNKPMGEGLSPEEMESLRSVAIEWDDKIEGGNLDAETDLGLPPAVADINEARTKLVESYKRKAEQAVPVLDRAKAATEKIGQRMAKQFEPKEPQMTRAEEVGLKPIADDTAQRSAQEVKEIQDAAVEDVRRISATPTRRPSIFDAPSRPIPTRVPLIPREKPLTLEERLSRLTPITPTKSPG